MQKTNTNKTFTKIRAPTFYIIFIWEDILKRGLFEGEKTIRYLAFKSRSQKPRYLATLNYSAQAFRMKEKTHCYAILKLSYLATWSKASKTLRTTWKHYKECQSKLFVGIFIFHNHNLSLKHNFSLLQRIFTKWSLEMLRDLEMLRHVRPRSISVGVGNNGQIWEGLDSKAFALDHRIG